jgi:iron complex outermembrane receptor protein
MVTNPKLTHAVHFALVSTATAAASMYTPEALSQDAELEQIVVTGSRIRRVDSETASPVFTMDRGTIESSGVTTMGALVQQVPSIAGAATNPAVNNGGGTGASTVELRGLGAERTLVLLNGRRVGAIASVGAVDVNILPVNLIERVEVLKEGAGAVYGSDAIGGVVNFITRKDLDGLEIGADYGVSDRGDGARQSVNLAWGMTGERGNFLLGVNYNKQDAIFAGDRKFSRNALYLYSSVVTPGGSSRVPNGRITFRSGSPLNAQYNCASNSVIKKDGAQYDGTHLTDYRCFNNPADKYNYQPINLIMTPQERVSLFTEGNYHITDTVDGYLELLHSETNSAYKIAELPFDAKADNIVIPANNYYNPFGEALGGLGSANGNGLWRLKGLGQRRGQFGSTSDQFTLGAKGKIMDSSWTWDLSGTYATSSTDTLIKGYLQSSKLKDAFGPSFRDPATGNILCGTPGNVIKNCIPVNIFNINSKDPAQVAAVNTIKADYNQTYAYSSKTAALDFAGDLFNLPAGMVQAAVGFSYNEQDSNFNTDTLTEAQPPLYLTCGISQEACSSDSRGSFNVKEVYGELLVPILKDVTAFKALNLTLGERYSDYNTFGSTTNGSVKLEWRPINDLLLRGSWAEVFRAPQINDLYGGRLSNSATFADPCRKLTAAQLAANPNLALACENVVPNGTFNQQNAQVTGLFSGNPNLKPETGDVLTYGLVYDPSWANGLSMNVDFWKYKISDVITSVDVNTTSDICVKTGDPTFCGFIQRGLDGQVIVIQQPSLNFGKLETSGVDMGIKYALRDTGIGSFQFTLDATYIDKYDSTPCPVCDVEHVAGTFSRQYGNYAKWRGLGSIGWGYDPFTALLSVRYIDSLVLKGGNPGVSINPDLSIPSKTYLDLSLGYTFWEKLTVTAGVDNLTNEQPPLLYQNNVTNANTDVSTYDTIGTYWRVGFKYKF